MVGVAMSVLLGAEWYSRPKAAFNTICHVERFSLTLNENPRKAEQRSQSPSGRGLQSQRNGAIRPETR